MDRAYVMDDFIQRLASLLTRGKTWNYWCTTWQYNAQRNLHSNQD